MQNTKGFTLIEMIVVMAIFVTVLAVAGRAFNVVLQNATIQSKTAETSIEGVLGLEMMRKDVACAGFGLPWSFEGVSSINYDEVVAAEVIASQFNSTPNIPLAVAAGNNLAPGDRNLLLDGTDYLVIRASNIGLSEAAQRWTYMYFSGTVKPDPVPAVVWPKNNLNPDDRVIVLRTDTTEGFTKEMLIRNGGFSTTFSSLSSFEPTEPSVIHYIFGVDDGDLRMPFNRADYFVRFPGAANMPDRCAPNTGTLFKATVNHVGGRLRTMPLLDCVADLQIVYQLESTDSGSMTSTDVLTGLTPQDIREQLKSMEVYILTHEGGRDRNVNYPNQNIQVGPAGIGRDYNLQTTIGDAYRDYRWMVYQISVKFSNLAPSLQ